MMWTRLIFGLLLTFSCINLSENGEAAESCQIDRNKCVTKQEEAMTKYSEENNVPDAWRKYLAEIKSARDSYVPCSGCDCYSDFLQQDLSPFDEISYLMLNKIRESVRHVVTYQIINGKVYRSKDCLFPIRCQGIEHFLTKLASEEEMPDTEFLVNTHDWPFISRHFEKLPLPLLSFSKTAEYYDISYPAWSFWAGGPATSLYPTGLGRWDTFRETLSAASAAHPWHSKLDRAFFRGSRTSGERDNLVMLSRQDPSLVDAQYTKNQAWRSTKDTLDADPAEEVSLEDHCRYRYLFNFRGVAASFRFKHLFLCGSLVLHAGADWSEFFYAAMRPWVHYVPVKADAGKEEIQDLLDFVRSHPEVAEEIANSGRRFVEENLRMEEVECYWRRLLAGYTRLLDFRPVRDEAYVEIERPK